MFRLIAVFIVTFFLFSCNPEEDDILGLDLIEDDEFIVEKHQFDPHLDFNVQNFQESNISGSGSYNLLGSFNDFYFGQSDASFFIQVLLPSNNVDFEASQTNPNIKLELSLPYYGAYGDTTQNQSISVYELTQNLSVIDTLQTDVTESFQYDQAPLLQNEIIVGALNDSVQWDGVTVSPRLILDLTASNLGLKILEANSVDLENNDNFTEFFKGLFLQVDQQTNGSIIYFDTNSPECFLRMTYNKDDGTQAIIEFPIGGEANTHNYFLHEYANSELINYLDNNELDSLVFLQSMGGLAMELNLSFLSNPSFSDWVISKASLNLPIYKDDQYDIFPAPSYLVLTEYKDSSDVAIQAIAGGAFNSVTEEYNFTITSHIQKIISNNHNSTLRLYVGGKNSNAERLIIDNRPDNGMNLELHVIK